ncbi:PolC-type DNA polymerase III [Lachnobacterium bovis]|uniref:DNA polymerase III PolC-type n=1 Tax=Lachnobacterium bovis DSM 14045 TaxID=1122142 RepID=A0A1H3FS54_9FIRM|nr:PolC-type DNA polymerase III [Lachnobacterium bovis]SDX93903.1 DNA polymerase-3 subunit alpha [Lachnobacterium bovis DSM 14045]
MKKFFDVFPTLKIKDNSVNALMTEAVVTKVSANRDNSRIRIYLHSTRLIFKKDLHLVESEIKNQLFPKNSIEINIIEKFTLSSQYNAQKLFDIYKESIFSELNEHSILEGNLLRKADISFTDEKHMTLVLEETIIAKTRKDNIVHFLEKVICERCGFDVIINPLFKEPQESKYRINSEKQIQEEVAHIVERTNLASQKKQETESVKSVPRSNNTNMEDKKDAHSTNSVKNTIDKNESYKQQDTSTNQNFSSNAQKSRFTKGENKRFDRYKKSNNPDVVYGRDFDEESIAIEKLDEPIGEVVIRGKILSVDTREIRNEKNIVIINVTDFTDSISIKAFVRNDQLDDILSYVKKGAFIKVKGNAALDKYDNDVAITNVVGIKKMNDFTVERIDTAPEKRVELHCHTKMSDMDGVTDVKELVKRAMKWGHKAIAITDHGDVQAFPDANHAVEGCDSDFKVIYGVEAYLVDDTKDIIVDSRNQSLDETYVVFDLETTGFSPENNKIIEIGAVKVEKGKIIDRFSTFVNPQEPIPFRIEELTSINDSMVINAEVIEKILPKFIEFCKGAIMVAHNADFDMSFIKHNCKIQEIEFNPTIIDTVALARMLIPSLNRFKLDTVAKAVGVSLDHHHRAVDDAECTAEIFVKFIEMLKKRDLDTLDKVNKVGNCSVETIMKMPTYHAIILATCDQGRTNLYKLVSDSNVVYYHKRPRIPKSEFIKHRDGLLIGSACEAGELFKAIVGGRPEEEIARLVEFYDYLEVQPIGNNQFMLEDDKYPAKTLEDLRDYNRKIVKLGEEFNKLVVATCDVHFMDPEDEVYRRIIMAGKGFKDADNQPPLYLHTTEEMLNEFSYLGSAKAEEIVIKNPNKIADMCEKISPVRPDKCPPVIENSDQMLRDICYNKAHKVYGENLPPIVKERLDRELNSIISNGYAVMYIIAQKLVWKSNEDGYLVGSRGSVGSSFVATMSGVTEVNPIHAHYVCPNCKYSDFDSDVVKSFAGRAGCDMPDKKCPVCGTPLSKDGFDIPFETFLGFKGNKEPDIDLNFSGEYQSKAHKYTEIIFGEGQTYKAGTIGTLADKTAFGFVKNYYEERGVHKRVCEIDRIVQGCVGVRRTTGQHPGGIVVLPMGEKIYTFTPIQHPANDMTVDITTTHFDYHSIDHNLLKLDILGHDDPTMIRMLQDLTGLDPTEIPLDDKSVMSLFQNTSALGVTPEEIRGCDLGALGIPEFGTDFAMGMLRDTRPKEFSDLIRISGLSHGTDVWLGNAQTLIQEGKATISTAICTRDDIMTYLIQKGLESEEAFKIMEAVRKGRVAGKKCAEWDEWKQDMIDHGVPDWYLWSCEKIKYMFPKAHAAAYVMMAWRIAYCKVYYPLAYYAAYFSIRATAFNYELMCMGQEKLESYMDEYEKRSDLSKKEQDTYKDMKIVQEMYARGFEFMPIDVYVAKPSRFQIIDGKLMPAFNTIDGLGDNAAINIAEASKDGPYLSKDDFKDRTKVPQKVCDKMAEMGLLGDIPESNQLSLFDFA